MICVALVACQEEPPVTTEGAGPPEIQLEVVEQHAEQFEADVPVREPGSEEEAAAASYILGHLQLAGYVPLLDSVPVENLVASTNVVARPAANPTALVAVGFGSSPREIRPGGEAIGIFLELARALKVAEPDHSVAFVALGTQAPSGPSDLLGTRRLLAYLEDQKVEPEIITISMGGEGESLAAVGAHARELIGSADGLALALPPTAEDVYQEAGLEHTSVRGPPELLGPALLEYLSGT